MNKSRIILCFFLASVMLRSGGNPLIVKLIKPERWASAPLLQSSIYPPLAGIANIQGDVIVGLIIDNNGKVQGTKVFSGPPQLRACAESMASTIKFPMSTTDIDGPWLYFVTAQFRLPARTITFVATPNEQIPPPHQKPTPK